MEFKNSHYEFKFSHYATAMKTGLRDGTAGLRFVTFSVADSSFPEYNVLIRVDTDKGAKEWIRKTSRFWI